MRHLWVIAVLSLSASTAFAAKNVPIVDLRFTPTDAVGSSRAFAGPAMASQAVELVFEDGRLTSDKQAIGNRTNDDDKLFDLTSKGDVATYVHSVIERLSRDWGIRLERGAPLVLKLTLAGLEVLERNQAVGATFSANVVFMAMLSQRDGGVLWNGKGTGGATRYGRKFSNDNINEVQSDALMEALAGLLNEPGLQTAWSGKTPSPAPAAAVATMTPEQMLDELKSMLTAGLGTETLVEFIRQRRLTAALSGADVAAWKAAGIPEDAIRAAIAQTQ